MLEQATHLLSKSLARGLKMSTECRLQRYRKETILHASLPLQLARPDDTCSHSSRAESAAHEERNLFPHITHT